MSVCVCVCVCVCGSDGVRPSSKAPIITLQLSSPADVYLSLQGARLQPATSAEELPTRRR